MVNKFLLVVEGDGLLVQVVQVFVVLTYDVTEPSFYQVLLVIPVLTELQRMPLIQRLLLKFLWLTFLSASATRANATGKLRIAM